MSPKKVWITPREAAIEMSKKAGYVVTPDDIKQLRQRGKIKRIKKVTDNLSLYNITEIQEVQPPKKRNPIPISNDFEKEAEISPQTS